MNGVKEVIDDLVRTATCELFSAYGTKLETATEVGAASQSVAIIGFSGGAIRGALGIAIAHDVAAAAFESAGGDSKVPGAVDDFIGELANQLLGRLKNKLLGYGTELHLAIPMVLSGVELRLVPTNGGDVWAYGFRADTGIVSVWLDARFDAEFVLAPQEDPSMLGANEGDMLLF